MEAPFLALFSVEYSTEYPFRVKVLGSEQTRFEAGLLDRAFTPNLNASRQVRFTHYTLGKEQERQRLKLK